MPASVRETVELRIEKMVATGRALARHEGRVVFVDGAYPGDLVRAEILDAKSDYACGRTVSVIEAGTLRQPSPCALFDRCGGCDWLDLAEAEQLRLARQMAEDALSRLLRSESFPLEGPVPSPRRLGYRRRAQLKSGPGGRLGFYRRGSRDVVPVLACPVLVPSLQRLLGPLGELAGRMPELREAHLLAGTDAVAVCLIGRSALPAGPEQAGAQLAPHGAGTILHADGTGRHWGPGAASIRVGPYTYTAPVQSFFQGNAAFDEELIRRVLEATFESVEPDVVLELYAGAGLFTLPLAARVREVVAVELDAAACSALRLNLAAAKLTATVLPLDAAAIGPRIASIRPRAVLIDPPRAGLARSVQQALLDCDAQRIAYLSCNLSTLARDLRTFLPRWRIRRIELFDLFPQTAHLEALAVLDRRTSQ
jgi:23S rRNA (uracil1939-C5)-methyltransferase